jgi:metal-responsive CopG/Arc/MetJ family transcriptional regulator
MKSIQMTIDEELLTVVDQLSRSLKTSRSAFIRHALERVGGNSRVFCQKGKQSANPS